MTNSKYTLNLVKLPEQDPDDLGSVERKFEQLKNNQDALSEMFDATWMDLNQHEELKNHPLYAFVKDIYEDKEDYHSDFESIELDPLFLEYVEMEDFSIHEITIITCEYFEEIKSIFLKGNVAVIVGNVDVSPSKYALGEIICNN